MHRLPGQEGHQILKLRWRQALVEIRRHHTLRNVEDFLQTGAIEQVQLIVVSKDLQLKTVFVAQKPLNDFPVFLSDANRLIRGRRRQRGIMGSAIGRDTVPETVNPPRSWATCERISRFTRPERLLLLPTSTCPAPSAARSPLDGSSQSRM